MGEGGRRAWRHAGGEERATAEQSHGGGGPPPIPGTVNVDASVTGNAVPLGQLVASALIQITDGSTLQSVTWSQPEGVPAVIQDFLHHPDFDRYTTDSLIRVSAAGAAPSPPVRSCWTSTSS